MPRTIKAPEGGGGGKRYPLNMKTTKETRERLEAAAMASGRSLAQEVEIRLERSFEQPGDTEEASRLIRMVGLAMNLAGRRAAELIEGAGDWVGHAWCYQQASEAAIAVLSAMRPPGEIVAPEIKPTVAMDEHVIQLFVEHTMKRLGANVGAYLASKESGK